MKRLLIVLLIVLSLMIPLLAFPSEGKSYSWREIKKPFIEEYGKPDVYVIQHFYKKGFESRFLVWQEKRIVIHFIKDKSISKGWFICPCSLMKVPKGFLSEKEKTFKKQKGFSA